MFLTSFCFADGQHGKVINPGHSRPIGRWAYPKTQSSLIGGLNIIRDTHTHTHMCVCIYIYIWEFPKISGPYLGPYNKDPTI